MSEAAWRGNGRIPSWLNRMQRLKKRTRGAFVVVNLSCLEPKGNAMPPSLGGSPDGLIKPPNRPGAQEGHKGGGPRLRRPNGPALL